MHALAIFVDRLTEGIWAGILLCYVVWLFYINGLFIDSYDLTMVRSLEELYYQRVLSNMRAYAAAGDWGLYFSEAAFGVGNIYWVTIDLLTRYFYNTGSDAVVIALPRQLSLVAFIGSFFFFVALGRARGYTLPSILAATMLIAPSGFVIYAATAFHNVAFISLALMASCYFMATSEHRPGRWLGAALFGLAIAIKAVSALALPIMFLFWNIDWVLSGHVIKTKRFALRQIEFFAVVIVSSLLLISPLAILIPFGQKFALRSFDSVITALRANYIDGVGTSFATGMWNSFLSSQIQWQIVVMGIVSVIAVLWTQKSFRFQNFIIPAVYVLAVVTIGAMFAITRSGDIIAGLYSVPYLYFIPMVFLELETLYKNLARLVLLSAAGMNIVATYPVSRKYAMYLHDKIKAPAYKATVERFNFYKSKNLLEPDDKVLIDQTIVFPADFIKRPDSTFYLTNGPIPSVDYDVFILSKQTPYWKNKDCTGAYSHENCQSFKNLLRAAKTFKVVYNDKDVIIYRNSSRKNL